MGRMACLEGSHAGSVLPGMESTPVQRTTDGSFVGFHYANLGHSTVQLSKAQLRKQEEEKKREEEEFKQWEKENKRMWKLVEAERQARASGGEWTVVMSDADRQTVDNLIYWEDEREREWQAACEQADHEDEDDDYDNEDSCRNCGSCGPGSASFEGCCSVRCAKDADQYD